MSGYLTPRQAVNARFCLQSECGASVGNAPQHVLGTDVEHGASGRAHFARADSIEILYSRANAALIERHGAEAARLLGAKARDMLETLRALRGDLEIASLSADAEGVSFLRGPRSGYVDAFGVRVSSHLVEWLIRELLLFGGTLFALQSPGLSLIRNISSTELERVLVWTFGNGSAQAVSPEECVRRYQCPSRIFSPRDGARIRFGTAAA